MRRILYTLIFILYTCSYAAAYPHLNFQNLNMSQGISDNYVRSISQDSWGMMWFITLNGIDSYDGYRSRHYNINNDPHWGDALYTIAEAGDSTLWVTGANDIYCYDRRSDTFSNNIMPVLKRYGVTTKPQKLFVDKDHCLWMQCGKNILYYDMGRKHLTTIPLPRDYAILSLMCRHGKARILMTGPSLTPGKGSEVWKVDIAQHKVSFLSYTGYPAKTFATLYLDTTGRLWYYDTHETHLCWFNENTRGWVSMPEFSPAMGRMVTFVMDDGDGNLWVGTDNNGIFVYDYQDQSVTQLQRRIKDTPIVYDSGAERSYLVDEHIVCFYKDDKSSTMWVGTSKLGAVFASLNQMPISLIPMRVYGGTHSADVSVIYQQPWNKESLLLGFDGQGIGMGSIENIGSFTHYTTANSQMPSNQILCTFTDSKGRQWWGSYAGELFYRQGSGFTSIHNEALKSVYSIKEDRRGTLWFGTWANGVFAMEKNGKLTNYSIQNTVFKTDNITDLAYDFSSQDKSRGRTLYVATSNGLYTMDIMTRKTAAILADHVNVLYLDRKTHILWIGLRTGLIARNLKTGKSTLLTTANGLSHNYILGITKDHYGNIWVSTKNGVSVVTKDISCTPFYAYDGLGKTTFNMHAITCASNGDILVGGIGYIVRITPRRTYDMNLSQYPVRLTGLSINGEDIQVGKEDSDGDIILGQNLQYTSTLTLHTWDRNVCIEVSAMNYANQHKIRYMYRLHDNEKWIPIESNVIQFNSLPAGRYLLQVKVAEPEGQNRNPVTTINLEVLAPWYASSLAYILYFCLVIGGIAYYIYYLKKKHLAQEKAEKERLQIAHEQDMNNAKMRFFTNVSHDLRTPLSLILTPLERMLSRDNLTADTRRQLELMQRSAETLKNDVTQLLDFRKLDESLEVLNAKECSLRALTEHECQKIDDSNLPNGIHLQVNLSDDPLFATVDERKMKRILNNLLSNAIKYNTPNGQIVVETLRDGNEAVLRVSDTGIGIKDSDRENIFDRFYQGKHDETTYVGSGIGLYIIKQYVNLHHGTITVKKNEPQGSVFEVRIPTSPNPSQGRELTNTDDSLKNVSTEKTNKISPPREGMGEVILVVEDNDDFRSFLVSCLCDQYTVLEAANGQEALDILSQLSAQDSKLLIISDVMMPVMDGMELLKKVKSDISLSHIPFIMLTARTAEEQQAEGLRDGADDYITKPFNLDILLLRIQRLLKWTENAPERFKKMDVKPSEITVSSLDEELITRAIKIVEDNMVDSEYTVDQLCDAMAMSRSGFYKKLSAITGMSPILFIRTLRIKRGRQLLEQGAGSISQIAYKIGLSPKQFAKYFKEEYGISPSELKK